MGVKIKKIIAILMTIVMILGGLQIKVISASENTGGTLTHNLAAKQIPFIYCYTNNDGTKKLNGNDTVIPKETYYVIIYIKASNIDINKSDSKIIVNGKKTYVSWSSSNAGYYTTAAFSINSADFSNIDININHSYKRDFSIRARKIITSNSSGATEMEKILNNNPATYQLYNNTQTVYLEGTINTAINSNNNFVHWTQKSGTDQYINGDDTYIRNLPNGQYTLIETDSGKGLKTIDKSSSSVWLNSSFIKESKGRKYYTFTITDETVNDWMEACVNDGESSSLFYGFYLENLKTIFNVRYDGNGYNGGMMMNHTNIKSNDTITLNENKFIRWGYTFTGWNTVANPTQENPGVNYADTSTMVVKEDTVLYAQWKKHLKIAHNVYIQDNSKKVDNIKEVDKKTAVDFKLAYNQDELNTILSKNLIQGYKYIETIIEVKNEVSDKWVTYQPGSDIKDKAQVRYILVIDKDLQQTKDISYNVEYWVEGEDTSRDTQKVTSKIWINDQTTHLEVKEIELKRYEGFEFSHFDPIQLPTTIEDGSIIKVYYSKIQTSILPEEPNNPDTPVTPDVPETPVIPEIPNITVVPDTIVNPIIPVLAQNPVQNNVVRTPINVPIEDNEVPTGNGETETIEDAEVPQYSGKSISEGSWALVNLICVFITIVIGLLSIILKHRKEENENNESKEYKTEVIYVRRRWTKALSVIIALISIIVFVLTENINLPMILTDKWTIIMIAIAFVQAIVHIVSRNYKNDKEQKVVYNQ
ncbi:MAG: InlB B-repeat-containing protein [Coprobacillus sp.]